MLTKGWHILKQTCSFQLCVLNWKLKKLKCVCVNILLPPAIKGLTKFQIFLYQVSVPVVVYDILVTFTLVMWFHQYIEAGMHLGRTETAQKKWSFLLRIFSVLRIWSLLLAFCINYALHKRWSFPLRISSVNVTKSAENCWFGHIYRKKSLMENFIFCAVWGLHCVVNEITSEVIGYHLHPPNLF